MTGILSGKQPKKTVDADTSVCLDDSELRPVFIPSPKKKAGVGCEEEGRGRRCGRILLCLIGFAVISVLLVAGATLFLFPHTSSYWLGLGRAWPLAHADDVDVEWSRAIQDEMERLSELGSFASNILYLGGVVPSVNYQLFPAATSIIRNLSETRQSQSETLDKDIASSHVHGKEHENKLMSELFIDKKSVPSFSEAEQKLKYPEDPSETADWSYEDLEDLLEDMN